jgi:hypothetical protein
MIRPDGNPGVTAGGYYQWLKSVLGSGEVEVFRAASAGVLVTSAWGHWGHNCRPSRSTLEAASGEPIRTLNRRLAVLTGAGWLHHKRQWNAPTVYCVALITDGRPRLPGPAGPCPLCFADLLDAQALAQPVPSIGSQVSSYQELSSGSAASGPPSESADDVRVVELTRLLIQHSSMERDDEELLAFHAVASDWIDRKPLRDLRTATRALAEKVETLNSHKVETFFERQRPTKESARERAARMEAERAARADEARALLRPMVEWETDRADADSAYWLRTAGSGYAAANPRDMLEEWREAGRGPGNPPA